MTRSLTSEPGRLLRARRVSQLLDVSLRHVYRLVQQGDLEAVRIGSRQIRITRESLDGLLAILGRDFPARADDQGDLRSHSPTWRERRVRTSGRSGQDGRDGPSGLGGPSGPGAAGGLGETDVTAAPGVPDKSTLPTRPDPFDKSDPHGLSD